MTDQKTPEGPQERPEGGSAGLASSGTPTGPQAGADSLGLREVIAGAIRDTPSTHPDATADAVYTRLKPRLAPHYQHAVDAAVAAERRAQQAEAALARVRRLADLIDTGAPWTANHTTLAQRIRDAANPPAHNAGPTVAECAEADRRWWGGQKAGE